MGTIKFYVIKSCDLAQMWDSRMFKIVHNLVLVETIKYIKLKQQILNLQQVLAKKNYYEMSFFPYTVKDKTLLAADSLKAFKARVVSLEPWALLDSIHYYVEPFKLFFRKMSSN